MISAYLASMATKIPVGELLHLVPLLAALRQWLIAAERLATVFGEGSLGAVRSQVCRVVTERRRRFVSALKHRAPPCPTLAPLFRS